ncbi:MAG: hypothetical protein CMJ32_10625 [Phycisphaerae bacterium]|nr:hypothetical protein [Phycisphaerae bacterium]
MFKTNAKNQGGRTGRKRHGFTLIETALATIIVGVGVLAIMAAQQNFHKQNAWSTHAATAMRLGNEIREMTLNLSRTDPVTQEAFWGPEPTELTIGDFDDLDDFDGSDGNGLIFSHAAGNGPINARREIIAGMDGWSQTVSVWNVDPFDITTSVADGQSVLIKFEVIVHYQGPMDVEPREITRVTWIAPG